jgi:hypothetical protein
VSTSRFSGVQMRVQCDGRRPRRPALLLAGSMSLAGPGPAGAPATTRNHFTASVARIGHSLPGSCTESRRFAEPLLGGAWAGEAACRFQALEVAVTASRVGRMFSLHLVKRSKRTPGYGRSRFCCKLPLLSCGPGTRCDERFGRRKWRGSAGSGVAPQEVAVASQEVRWLRRK